MSRVSKLHGHVLGIAEDLLKICYHLTVKGKLADLQRHEF